MKKQSKVPVSRRAVEQRINRALATDGEKLLRTRSNRMFPTLGNYYIVNVEKNFIREHHVQLNKLAGKLKVLKGYEYLETEGGE